MNSLISDQAKITSFLKVHVPKSLENEFSLTGRYGHFSNQNIIHGEKIANMYLIYKQFEKTMFMLLIVL